MLDLEQLQSQSWNNRSQRKKRIIKSSPLDNCLNGTKWVAVTLCTPKPTKTGRFLELVSSLEIDLFLSWKDRKLAFPPPYPIILISTNFFKIPSWQNHPIQSITILLNKNYFLPQLVLVVLLRLYWKHQAFFLGPVKMYDEIICL